MIKTDAKSLSSSSPDIIQLHKCNDAYSVLKILNIKETFLIEYINYNSTM